MMESLMPKIALKEARYGFLYQHLALMIGQIDDAILKAQFTDAVGGNIPKYVFQRIAPKNRL